MRAGILALFLCMTLGLVSQESFRHMHYNLTLYGNPFACDENTNNTLEKDEALRTIIEHVQPDIFTVNEVRDQDFWADRILDEVLNQDETLWSRAPLGGQFTTSSILNAFYYRQDKFVLSNYYVLNQDVDGGFLLRPINFYTVYAITPELESGDTTYVNFAIAHLAASDADERSDQTEAAMNFIPDYGLGNYIFAGDLNMDSANEEAFQNLIAHPDPALNFHDPVITSSSWSNNPNVSAYHTQSTRFSDTNNGCFAGGGLDDRFDITLINEAVLDGSLGLQYIANSYEVVGQSGSDYNQELQTIANAVVPDEVAQALYDMSDHLPVQTDYGFNIDVGLSERMGHSWQVYRTAAGLRLVGEDGTYELRLYDLSGRLQRQEKFNTGTIEIERPYRGVGQISIAHIHSSDGSWSRLMLAF